MGLISSLSKIKFYSTSLIGRLLRGFSYGANMILGSKSPIWIDTGDLNEIYETNPIVKLVIDRKASMFSSMKITAVDIETGEEIDDNPLAAAALELLKKPNPLQAFNELAAQYMIHKSVFGNAFGYGLRGNETVKLPVTMWNLPAGLMKAKPTGKIFKQTKLEDIISKYTVCYRNGDTEDFEPNEVLHKNDITSNGYITSPSRLYNLKKPISNIEGAYQTRNVVIYNKGAIGILSNNNKDDAGGIPLDNTERERIQNEYQNQYGITDEKAKVLITNAALKWQPMSYPLRDLMVFEEVQEGLNIIADAYGLNSNIFSKTAGATFENMLQSRKDAYEATIQPEADDWVSSLTDYFGLREEGIELRASYNHLPIMQEDAEKLARTMQATYNALQPLVERGIITEEELISKLGI